MICPKCGDPVGTTDTVCLNCNEQISRRSRINNNEGTTTAPPNQTKRFCNRCGMQIIGVGTCSGCSSRALNSTALDSAIDNFRTRFNLAGGESQSAVYERGKNIVPDCITPDQGEIPLRQYSVAILRSRLKFQRAEGRLQVTNKRILFRAKGISLPGKTLLEYEFNLGEISGIEARTDYKMSMLNLFIGLLFLAIGSGIATPILGIAALSGHIIFAYILGIAGIVPWFLLKNKSAIKIMSLGVSQAAATVMLTAGGFSTFFGGLTMLVVGVLIAVTLFLYMFVPNLVLSFKTKGASTSVDIRCKKSMGLLAIFGKSSGDQEFTGFDDVLPAQDAERAINEVNAMINDLNTVGDMAIKVWEQG
jgi:hypothetical protein